MMRGQSPSFITNADEGHRSPRRIIGTPQISARKLAILKEVLVIFFSLSLQIL
jgi:hypothetical protein